MEGRPSSKSKLTAEKRAEQKFRGSVVI